MMGYNDLDKRTRRGYTVAAMKELRLPHESLWADISNLLLPFRYRANNTEQNKPLQARNIYNSTGARALKVLQSGLMAAATDPSSQWITFGTEDPDRAEYGPHRRWLDYYCTRVLETIGESNAYRNLPVGYGNSAGFGLFAMGMETVGRAKLSTRLYNHGRFWIADNDLGETDSFYEEARATVRQLYMRFGEDADFSPTVRRMAEEGKWNDWVDVAHLIEPNEYYQPESKVSREKRYADCWWELGTSQTKSSYGPQTPESLYEGGFETFPVLVGKWSAMQGEVYPVEYPGNECLGDNKSLQVGEKRMWQAITKLVDPHWIVPAELQGSIDEGFLPGRYSYVTEREAGKSIRPAHMIDPAFIAPMRDEILAVQQRILDSFHYSTFSTFDAEVNRKQMTATEVLERKSEKLLRLSDMYTNLQGGVLTPLVEYVGAMLIERGVIEPAPPDLQGHKIKIQFNGVLAQAQKMNRIQPIQFVMGIAQQIAQAQQVTGQPPEIFDKLNADQSIDEVATDIGAPATIIRSDEEVAAIRQERAAALKQQQQMAALQQATQAAKNLGQAKLDDNSALGALVGAA